MDNPTTPDGPVAGDGRSGTERSRFAYLNWPRGRRRVMAVATAVVLSGLAALPVIALTSSGGPGKQHSALVFTGPATTEPAPTTTEAPPTTVPATTTTVAAVNQSAPTTTTLVCRNSYDQACGPFRWDPSPAPAGTPTVSIKVVTANPVVGQPVTFNVTISDPNTAVYTCGQVSYGDGMNENCSATTAGPACRVRYGPWTPPARYADSVSTSFTYPYKAAGTYTVSAKYPVGSSCYDPYQGWATGSTTVTIGAAPPTTAVTTTTTTIA